MEQTATAGTKAPETRTDDRPAGFPKWNLIGPKAQRERAAAALDELAKDAVTRAQVAVACGETRDAAITEAMAAFTRAMLADGVYAMMSSCCAHDRHVFGQLQQTLDRALSAKRSG